MGDDRLDGGAGLDVLEGDAGNDILYGNGGHDTLRGGGDVDRLYGGFGNDSLDGSFGWDVLVGNDGADTLNGGIGNDRLTGGADADVFQFTAGDGTDTVFDYQDGTERIKILSGATAFGDLTINNDAGAAVITYGNVTIRLNGVADTLLDVTDFIF